ncbi:aminoglycoside phosphotransferase family protein [Azospirillum isscasi]|uniref:Aminoglycoside phosphotransferase domain-containing protein n=1 Tax=Azospirillum isscasi TaxID=3053926 RepID=A0ABU0WNM8_9PROT|nr:hypothetical protein [Azospirillum isscasi]MDQ2105846.1 hypothetical protein [Azospirillum isscasi]
MTCSVPAASPEEVAALLGPVERLLGRAVPASALRRVAGGGNNRLYRLDGSDGPLALKWYGERTAGDAARLRREFGGLRFLAEAGVAGVPGAVAADPAAHAALYDWIDGEPASRDPAGRRPDDLAQALAFVGRLRDAATLPAAQTLPEATEACLSAADLLGQIDERRDRLMTLEGEAELRAFIGTGLAPALAAARARLWALYDGAGLAPGRPVPPAARTLSPSDFGFHNALRRPDGRLVFVDFEYFGWDDPVKLTADLLWHPGQSLSLDERRAWLSGTAALFAPDPSYGVRLRAQVALFGLRWALIMLNEFLPDRWTRRLFAAPSAEAARAGWDAAKRTQLAKAEAWTAAARRIADAGPEPALFPVLPPPSLPF